MSRFRLVAFDLDGTLIDRDIVVRSKVRTAIERMHAMGIRGCIVTGRMYRAALPYARELRFDAPLICYQGAAIVDPNDDRVMRDLPIASPTVHAIVDAAESEELHVQLYRNDDYYCEERNRFSDLYARLANTQPVIVPSLREAFAFSPATKAVIIADAPVAQRKVEYFRSLLGARAYVTRSYPEFVEILNPVVDKGDALRYVAAHLGVPMEEVLAIGDSWNDAPLLRAAGFGVAMGSAPPELREIADAMVDDVAHDGVAEALDRYVLG